MTRKGLKFLLIFSICITGILFQPKFHKPPIEFQIRVLRLLIEYSFFVFIGIAIISGFILLNGKLAKALYTIIGLPLLGFVFLGLFFTRMNNGNTYNDIRYYRIKHNEKFIIEQYYDHGAFGSDTRFIITKSLSNKIRFIKYFRDFNNKSDWIEIDKNGIEIKK